MERNVPEYVSASVSRFSTARVPWYKSTFPSYFGIFLLSAITSTGWADDWLMQPHVVLWCWWVAAGLLCFGLYDYVPGMLGMQTGTHALTWSALFDLRNYRGFLIPES